ncbi:MAG TPA: hypothetical protein PLM75_00755 [bacterium]|nr:hypothetical protein [bacterium]
MNNLRFLIIISAFIFFSCVSKKIIAPEYKQSYNIIPIEAQFDEITKSYKVELDGIIILFKFANFEFLKDNFSMIVQEKKIFSEKGYKTVPFYFLNTENITSEEHKKINSDEIEQINSSRLQTQEKRYFYETNLTPFYFSVKNNNQNKILFDICNYCVIVDENGRQYNTLSYEELKKYNLHYTFKEKYKISFFKRIFMPVFRYAGISYLTEAISATPAGKLSLFNVSVSDVTNTVNRVSNIQEYKFKHNFPENLMFKNKYIYPNAIENGFIVFPKISDDIQNMNIMISDIITKFNDDGTPAKAYTITIKLSREKLKAD